MTNTPETLTWLLSGVLVTAVHEGCETTISLTCTTRQTVDDARTALTALLKAIHRAANERRNLTQNPRSRLVDDKEVTV
jgi:hypothetical protein